MKSKLAFLMVFFMAFAISGSAAEKTYAGHFVLDEILIEDLRPEIESTSRLRVVSREELDQRGVKTLDEAIEMLPGINVRVGNGGTPRIDIRGYRSRHVTLMIDGVPLNSTYDGQLDPRLIPVEIISKIKVSYGTASAIYGTGALGGVINIITRRGKQEKDRLFLQTETGTRISQYGILRASGSDGDFDYFLGLSNELRNGFELSDNFSPTSSEDGDRRENSDLRRSSMLLRVGLTPSSRWQWGLTVGHQRAEFGLPHSTINDPADIFANKIKFERVDNLDGRIFQFTSAYDAPGPWEFKFWYFYNRQEEETNAYDDASYVGMTDPKVKGTYHQDSKTLIRGQNFQAIRSMGADSSLALSIRTDRSDWVATGQIRDVKVGKNYDLRSFYSNHTLRNHSLAAEYNSVVFKNVDLVLGASVNKQKRDDRGDQSGNEYNLGFSKKISEKTTAHLAAARKIRFPAIRQLYDASSGNANLELEKVMNYEAGLVHQFDERTSGGLTLFHSTVKDYIEKNDTTSLYENFQKYRFKGVELTAQHKCSRPLVLKSSLTLMDSEEVDSQVGRDELQYRPKVKFTFAATYKARNGLQAHCEFLHIDRQNFYSKKAPFQKAELNEINLTNFRVSKPIRYDSMTLYLGVDNLFDRNYETSYGVPAPGRFWYLGLQASL